MEGEACEAGHPHDNRTLHGPSPEKITKIAQSSLGVVAICDTGAMANVSRSKMALGVATTRVALLPKGDIITRNLDFTSPIFLPLIPCMLYFSCLASALERSRSYVFDVQKKEGGGFGNGVSVFVSSLFDIASGLSIKRG